MKMVPFLNNQKGYNCSTTHSVSLFVSTTTAVTGIGPTGSY